MCDKKVRNIEPFGMIVGCRCTNDDRHQTQTDVGSRDPSVHGAHQLEWMVQIITDV